MPTAKIDLASLEQTHWSDTELANARLVADFVQHLMNDHDFAYVRANFDSSSYVQHNRSIPDGLGALVDFVSDFARRFPEYSYDVKRICADGEFIIFHSHVTIKARHRGDERKGLIITDTWRIVDGKITDHWDAIQPIDTFMRLYALLTGGKLRNHNPTF